MCFENIKFPSPKYGFSVQTHFIDKCLQCSNKFIFYSNPISGYCKVVHCTMHTILQGTVYYIIFHYTFRMNRFMIN